MGCKGSKATAPKVDAKATLLDAPTQKAEKNRPESFAIFTDSLGGSSCLAPAESDAMLRVEDVEGGPIGLWNNRARTEKVKKGDLVMKVRKANDSQWIAGDAKQMLAALTTQGPFEVEIKCGMPQELEQPTQEEVPTVNEGAQVEAPVGAPAVQGIEVEAPVAQGIEVEAPVEAPVVQGIEAAVEARKAAVDEQEVAEDPCIDVSEAPGDVSKGCTWCSI